MKFEIQKNAASEACHFADSLRPGSGEQLAAYLKKGSQVREFLRNGEAVAQAAVVQGDDQALA